MMEWFDGDVILLVEMLELDGGFEPCLEIIIDFIDELLMIEFVGIDIYMWMTVLLHNINYISWIFLQTREITEAFEMI